MGAMKVIWGVYCCNRFEDGSGVVPHTPQCVYARGLQWLLFLCPSTCVPDTVRS